MRVARTVPLSNFHRVVHRVDRVVHLILYVLISMTWVLLLPALSIATDEACTLVKDATRVASEVRGLKIRKAVPCKIQNKEEVKQFLLDTIKEKIPRERIANEGELYKILGIIPKDFKYLEGLVNLYTSQLGGYYDPDKEYYAMASWMPVAMQFPIAVHEMTHALQDQYYELDKLMDHFSLDSDLLSARSALVEGDATAVMMDFARKAAGQGPIAEEKSVASMMMQNIAGAMMFSSVQDTPSALQAMLIFPYVSGLRFAHALLREGGYKRIDQAFKVLPESTEHILHPEIFLRKERGYIDVPTPSAPTSTPVASTTPEYSDRLGEFFIATFLGAKIPAESASTAASGWGGDRVALYQLKGSSRHLLVWVTHWDTELDGDEFFEALTTYYEARLSTKRAGGSNTRTFLDPDFGPVEVFHKGKHVRLTVGR